MCVPVRCATAAEPPQAVSNSHAQPASGLDNHTIYSARIVAAALLADIHDADVSSEIDDVGRHCGWRGGGLIAASQRSEPA